MLSFVINGVTTHLTSIIWIIVLFILAKVLLRRLVKKAIELTSQSKREAEFKQRAQALGSIIVTAGNVVIYLTILLMILSIFGVNIGPILAGAGILGIAVGFGSQTLVKDFVSGLFVLLENQYTIGEKVKIAGYTGTVLKISLRSTLLKDEEENIVFISNSNIKEVINYSRK